MTRKGIIIIVLLLISASIIPFVIFSLQFFALVDTNGGGVLPPPYDTLPSKPVLSDIQPDPDTDGIINLDWSDSSDVVYYNVYRRKSNSIEAKIAIGKTSSSFIDSTIKESGLYYYRIEAVNNIGKVWSNEKSVTIEIPLPPPPPPPPTNPSITINNGANTTNSFTIILTLSCNNADEMQFQISEDIWINWTAYSTTYPITLFRNDPWYPNYLVGVIFRNDYGETKMVCDDIIYDSEGEPPPPDKDEEIDYTLAYVLIGVLIGLIGIGIFLKFIKSK